MKIVAGFFILGCSGGAAICLGRLRMERYQMVLPFFKTLFHFLKP
jgi:hypothetical protein